MRPPIDSGQPQELLFSELVRQAQDELTSLDLASLDPMIERSAGGLEFTLGPLDPSMLRLALEKATALAPNEIRYETGAPDDPAAHKAAGPVPNLLRYESGAYNDTPASAESVPAAAFTQVRGQFAPGDMVDMFRIKISADTTGVAVTVKASPPTEAFSGQLLLWDETGNLVGNWSFPADSAGLTLNITRDQSTTESSMVVGLMAAPCSTSPALPPPVSDYELQIEQEAPPPSPPAGAQDDPNPVPPSTPPPAPPPESRPDPQPEPMPHHDPVDHDPPTTPGPPPVPGGAVINPVEVVVGQLPLRTAGPLGGSLDDGTPTTPTDRIDAVLVDLQWTDILPQGAAPGSEEDVSVEDVPEPGEPEPPPMIALQSPGGFPLLAASLASQRPSTPAAVGTCLPELPDAGGQVPRLASQFATRPSHSAGETATPDAPRKGNRPTRHGSVAIGLNAAAVLAFGLLLPDLVALLKVAEPKRRLPRT